MDDRLAAYIERVVAKAPPLTAAQRDRLATILAPQDRSRPRPSSAVRGDPFSALESVVGE